MKALLIQLPLHQPEHFDLALRPRPGRPAPPLALAARYPATRPVAVTRPQVVTRAPMRPRLGPPVWVAPKMA